ncbi:MAG: hypothetical protein J6C90_00200 [Clostridia bacterium]|nr:hypothetical protein [Clostridia bacterium]
MKLYEIINMIITAGLVVTAIVLTTVFLAKIVKAHKKPIKTEKKEDPKPEENVSQDAELEEMKTLFKESTAKPRDDNPPKQKPFQRLSLNKYSFGERADKTDENTEISAESEISTGSVDVEPESFQEEHTKYRLVPSQMQGRKVRTRDLQDMMANMSPEVRMLLLTDIFKPKF